MRQLHLTLLVIRLVRVSAPFVTALALWNRIHLAVCSLDVVRYHAELAHMCRIGVEIQSGVANPRICNDSAIFALWWHAALVNGIGMTRLLLAHLCIIIRLLDPVVSRSAEVDKTLLVLLNEGLVVRHGHFQSGNVCAR